MPWIDPNKSRGSKPGKTKTFRLRCGICKKVIGQYKDKARAEHDRAGHYKVFHNREV